MKKTYQLELHFVNGIFPHGEERREIPDCKLDTAIGLIKKIQEENPSIKIYGFRFLTFEGAINIEISGTYFVNAIFKTPEEIDTEKDEHNNILLANIRNNTGITGCVKIPLLGRTCAFWDGDSIVNI